jgi:hypothetical protein
MGSCYLPLITVSCAIFIFGWSLQGKRLCFVNLICTLIILQNVGALIFGIAFQCTMQYGEQVPTYPNWDLFYAIFLQLSSIEPVIDLVWLRIWQKTYSRFCSISKQIETAQLHDAVETEEDGIKQTILFDEEIKAIEKKAARSWSIFTCLWWFFFVLTAFICINLVVFVFIRRKHNSYGSDSDSMGSYQNFLTYWQCGIKIF